MRETGESSCENEVTVSEFEEIMAHMDMDHEEEDDAEQEDEAEQDLEHTPELPWFFEIRAETSRMLEEAQRIVDDPGGHFCRA